MAPKGISSAALGKRQNSRLFTIGLQSQWVFALLCSPVGDWEHESHTYDLMGSKKHGQGENRTPGLHTGNTEYSQSFKTSICISEIPVLVP